MRPTTVWRYLEKLGMWINGSNRTEAGAILLDFLAKIS